MVLVLLSVYDQIGIHLPSSWRFEGNSNMNGSVIGLNFKMKTHEHMRRTRGGGNRGSGSPSLKNHKNIGFLSNTLKKSQIYQASIH